MRTLTRRSALGLLTLTLGGCAVGASDGATGPSSGVTGPNAADPTDPTDPTSPNPPTSAATQPSEGTATAGPSAPMTPAPAMPSLVGDTRNAWAFAPLDQPDRVVVEGRVSHARAWSTSKVVIVAAYLAGVVKGDPTRLTSAQKALITRTLGESDVRALMTLRGAIPGGYQAGMTSILRSVGDTTTVVPPQKEGTMPWAVRDQLQFVLALGRGGVVSPAVSAFLLDHMRPVTSQRWGLGRVGATAFKGGWLRATTETRQMGILHGYAVCLITDAVGPAVKQIDGEYAHEQQLDTLAQMLSQRLGRASATPAPTREP